MPPLPVLAVVRFSRRRDLAMVRLGDLSGHSILLLMERSVSDSLVEICEITLRAYMDVTGESAGTDMEGVLGVLAAIGRNLYYATAREGSPGIPDVEHPLARLTLEAYVLPFGDDLREAMVEEGIPRCAISSTFKLDFAEEIAERVYGAGYRPTVQVYGTE